MIDQEIPNYWAGNCFGCSPKNPQSLRLRFWLTEEGCVTKCVIPEDFCGIDGIVHGGIVTMLLEEVAQWTIVSRLGKLGITRQILVRYLKPVPTNVGLVVTGRIVGQDERDVILQSNIHSEENMLLAQGESRWLLASPATVAKLSLVEEAVLEQFLSHYPVQVSSG
jgi:acyl-coenzyme A thioesterase PaaI-like protein